MPLPLSLMSLTTPTQAFLVPWPSPEVAGDDGVSLPLSLVEGGSVGVVVLSPLAVLRIVGIGASVLLATPALARPISLSLISSSWPSSP
jgi:hypothetical protein